MTSIDNLYTYAWPLSLGVRQLLPNRPGVRGLGQGAPVSLKLLTLNYYTGAPASYPIGPAPAAEGVHHVAVSLINKLNRY